MFSKKSKGPGPTENYLKATSDPNIKELLEKEDLSTQFREKNPYLIGYFLGKNSDNELNMKNIFKHVMETENRDDQKKFFSLYQMSNTCLHRVLADSVELSQLAFESVDQADRYKAYAMGVFSRILSRAIDQWPEEIWQVFWNTEGGLEKVIKNLDSTCIYQSILDCFMQKQHPHISNLMWYIFISFIPQEKAKKYLEKPPSFTIFIQPIDLQNDKDLFDKLHNSLKKYHKLNIISLLIEYFKCSLDKITEFHEIVFDYIASATEEEMNGDEEGTKYEIYPRLFEVAKIIGPDERVINKALEIIKDNTDLSLLKVQYSAQYLSVCTEKLDEKTTNQIIDKLLKKESQQFTILAVLKLISYAIEDEPNWINKFKKETMAKIIKLWKEISTDHLKDTDPQNTSQTSFLLLDSILTIGRMIYNSEVNKIYQKYIDEEQKNKKKSDDENNEEEGKSDEEEQKQNPNQNEELIKEISKIGEGWEDWNVIKEQVINWSQQDFIEQKKDKQSKSNENSSQEEREKSIVILFNDAQGDEQNQVETQPQ